MAIRDSSGRQPMALFEPGNTMLGLLAAFRAYDWEQDHYVKVRQADPIRYVSDLSPISIYVWPYSSSINPLTFRQITYAVELSIVRSDLESKEYVVAEGMLTKITMVMIKSLYIDSSIDFEPNDEDRNRLSYRAYFSQGAGE